MLDRMTSGGEGPHGPEQSPHGGPSGANLPAPPVGSPRLLEGSGGHALGPRPLPRPLPLAGAQHSFSVMPIPPDTS